MADNRPSEKDRARTDRSQSTRPIIGFLTRNVGNIYRPMEAAFWSGVADAAQERNANLICFAGGRLRSPDGFEAQANVLYDLVDIGRLDGLIVTSEWLRRAVTIEEFTAFLGRYRALPMVSYALSLEGIPCVSMEYEESMRDLLIHLIETHGHRRIAFIRGPERSRPGEVRYRVFQDVMADYGLPIDPNLVVSGDYKKPSGVEAMHLLLDERKAAFDAVVASNDSMAIGALEALQARGIRVPDDVAVVGFNDIPEASSVTPPLTTAVQPFYEAGRQVVETVLAQIAGERVRDQICLPMEVVLRQSCGCLDPAVVEAAAGPVGTHPEKIETILAIRREEIVAEMVRRIGDPAVVTRWAERLLEGLVTELVADTADSVRSQGIFLRELDQVLRLALAQDRDVALWQGAISSLRRHLVGHLSGQELLLAEDLWQQARVAIDEMAQRAQARQTLQAQRRTKTLREIGAALITTFDVPELMDVLAEGLPRLGIPSCYLSLYEHPDSPAERARLILAYDENGRASLESGGKPFPSPNLVPDGTLPPDRQYTMVVEPLYFREHQIGFVLFEAGPHVGSMYEALRVQISSALEGALLLQARREAEAALEKAYAEVEKQIARTPLIREAQRGRQRQDG